MWGGMHLEHVLSLGLGLRALTFRLRGSGAEITVLDFASTCGGGSSWCEDSRRPFNPPPIFDYRLNHDTLKASRDTARSHLPITVV